MKIARIYQRVSTDEQSLQRQEYLIKKAQDEGYYVAGVYSEKASGATANRPELLRMIKDLQKDDVIIAERMDRISRLPLPEAEKLIKAIKRKGAKLAIPDLVDLSDLVVESVGIAKIMIETFQEAMLKIALHLANSEYEELRRKQAQGIEIAKQKNKYKGRQTNKKMHKKIIELRSKGFSITRTAEMADCSVSTVKRVTKEYKESRLKEGQSEINGL